MPLQSETKLKPKRFTCRECSRLNNDTQRYQVLVSGICECDLFGKRVFADVIKLKILGWEILGDYLGGFNVITKALSKRP